MKKFQLANIVVLSITLFACGGSGGDSAVDGSGGDSVVDDFAVDTTKELFIKNISETSWVKECVQIFHSYLTIPEDNFITITIGINSSLKSINKIEAFSEPTCNHHSLVTRLTFTTQLEITDKIISDESIEVYGLNTYFVESSDITELPPSYSLIYLDSERLYYGIDSGLNLGESNETRHTSISLDDYFSEIVN